MMALRNLPRRTRRSTALAACVVALPLALTACGDDDSGEGGEGRNPAAVTSASSSPTATPRTSPSTAAVPR